MGTQTHQLNAKQRLFHAVARSLFSSPALKLTQHFVNGFCSVKNVEGELAFPFLRKRRSRNVQILGYHRVNDDADPFFPAVPTQIFARQMEHVAACYHILPLEEAVERMQRDDAPDNALVVTFDDGYRDNYLNAFPILRKLSIPATVFLSTRAISDGPTLWHDRVFAAFRETKTASFIGIGNKGREYFLRTVEEKLIAQAETLSFLRSIGDNERSRWIDDLVEKLKVADRRTVPNLMLTWEDVREMYANGIRFGSHTVTHPILSRLSLDQASMELYDSKREIEERLRVPIRTFAYPSGKQSDFNETIKGILQEAGYACAVTAIFGVNGKNQDLYELRRSTPWEIHLPSFAMKLMWYRFSSE